jgi:hypothetical protein
LFGNGLSQLDAGAIVAAQGVAEANQQRRGVLHR